MSRSAMHSIETFLPPLTESMAWGASPVEIGIDSFAAAISDPATGETLSAAQRLRDLLAEMEMADRVGLTYSGSVNIIARNF